VTAMPKVKAYPLCSECNTPYVLRMTFVLGLASGQKSEDRWLWQRDCKHKKAAPKVAPEAPPNG
jgi:hypothetical protein